MNLEPRTLNKAMTLVELLVVMAIVGIVVGISVPALGRYAGRLRLKTTTRELVGLISLARSLAISAQEDHAVIVAVQEGEVSILNLATGEPFDKILRLPSAVTLEMQSGGQPSTETQFVFRSSGALSGRTVSLILSQGEKSQTITVTGATGAVTVN